MRKKLSACSTRPSPIERGSILGADICEYKAAVSAYWDASFIQLGAGALDAGIEYLVGDNFTLYRDNWHQRLHLVGTLLPGMIAFGISSRAGQGTRWWGQSLSPGCIPIGRSNDEMNLVAGANEGMTVLTMREGDFLRIFEHLTGLASSDFPGEGRFLELNPGAERQLLKFWNSVLAQTSTMDRCEWQLVDLVAPLLAALELPVLRNDMQSPKAALLNRLMHIAETTDFQATVPEISQKLGVSRRSIEYLFHDLIGESPRAYFIARRLSLCKQELAEAGQGEITVAAVAIKHGFYELGRFASVYRRYFGELPSITLRRNPVLVTLGMRSWETDVSHNDPS
ncbi:MAG: helix-turn-helix domain-containing protein [Halioglobus sp.]